MLTMPLFFYQTTLVWVDDDAFFIKVIADTFKREYLTKILNRIVLPGSIYLAMIALIPTLIQGLFKFPSELAYLLGGTSLLILVGVDLDTMAQIESILKMHHHDGLTRHGHIKGRNL